jgi:hypothetical protein
LEGLQGQAGRVLWMRAILSRLSPMRIVQSRLAGSAHIDRTL